MSLTAAPIKIMPLGDSITEGIAEIPLTPDQNSSYYPHLPNEANLTVWQDRIAYRGKLWDLLKAEGVDVDFVGSKTSGSNYATADFDTNHEGYGGQTSEYIKEHINDWLTLNPADIILLHIGTNDGGSATPIGITVENIDAILNTIFTKNPNAKVFVARIIEARRVHQNQNGGGIVSSENPRGFWYTKDLNDAVENMINNHAQTANIKVVDMESAAGIVYDIAGLPNDMQPYHSEDDRPDYHPNENGYTKMAQKWFDEILASGWLVPPVPIVTDHSWKLEAGSPYIDSKGNSDAICFTTGCPTQVEGKVGNAVYFSNNASKQILEANVDAYDMNESFSIELWLNPDDTTSGLNEVALRHGSLWIGRNNNTLRYKLPGIGIYNSSAGDLNTGWNHVVLVYDASIQVANTYINGVETDVSSSAAVDMTETFLYIGHYYSAANASTNYAYHGAIDEVAIYRSALSATEVGEYYDLGNTNYSKNDFSKDGRADILWRKENINHLWVMNEDGTHSYVNIGSKSSAYSIAGLNDLNADGITDILWRKGHKNYIWYMNTDGTHTYKKISSKSYNVIAVKDFNNDGIADILWRLNDQNNIWYMNANGSYSYKNIGGKSSSYSIVGTGDLNADGITDILWRKGHQNYIWYMNEDGTHTYKKINSKSYTVKAVEDFNNDGIADILWRKDNNNHIWYMNTNGTYTYKNIGTKGSTYSLVNTADYNGDGITDILWRKGSSNYIWYMHLDGSHTYKKISGKNNGFSVQ
jgi:lysophospholipase L1-like esterase